MFREVAIGAAMGAGNILRDRFGSRMSVEYKGEVDLVTETDRASERLITRMIREHFPTHGILGEEGTRVDGESPFSWVIDPVDGTTNFAHAFPFVAVSIGLLERGAPVLGVVHNPLLEETFVAEKGKGATLNGKPIQVSGTGELKKAFLATGFPYEIREHLRDVLYYFARFLVEGQAVRRPGAASLDLCYLAKGVFDGFWERYLHPWDIAAGALIVQEAGGRVSDFSGDSLDLDKGEILATNSLIHDQMRLILSEDPFARTYSSAHKY